MVNAVRFLRDVTVEMLAVSNGNVSTPRDNEVTFKRGEILCCEVGDKVSTRGDSDVLHSPAVAQDLLTTSRIYTVPLGSFEVIELVPKQTKDPLIAALLGSQIVNKVFESRVIEDYRINSIMRVSNQELVDCMNLVEVFGFDACLGDLRYSVIKVFRKLSSVGLKDAKDLVEVVSLAYKEDTNFIKDMKRRMNEAFPELRHCD